MEKGSNDNDLPVRVNTALEDETSARDVHLVPNGAHALAHPGKVTKILNKKQTLRIGENVSLLNSETKEVNLRFVSSSAPTLRSALHF